MEGNYQCSISCWYEDLKQIRKLNYVIFQVNALDQELQHTSYNKIGLGM